MACKKRNILLNICVLQLLTTIWRQIFDYLGFMWGPILANFFHMIFVIFGFFGAWQYKAKYLFCFVLWEVVWSGWNIFLLCFYLNVGSLNRESDLLSLGTGSVSWWEANGPGCKALFLSNQTGIETDPWRPLRPDLISGCIIPYHRLEIAQAIIQIILTVLSIYFSCMMNGSIKNGEPNASPSKKNNIKLPSAALYSPGYISHPNQESESMDEGAVGGGSRPMTPRRVKRRSINGRSSGGGSLSHHHHHRHSHRQKGGGSIRQSSHRRSQRSSRPHSLPPTLLDQHTLLHPRRHHYSNSEVRGHTNVTYQQSSTNSLAVDDSEERPPSARSSYSNFHGMRGHTFRQSNRNNFLAAGPPGYTSETGV